MIAGVVGRTAVACGDGDGPYGHGHGDDGSVGRWRSLLVDVVWTTFVGNDVPAIILFDSVQYKLLPHFPAETFPAIFSLLVFYVF